MPPRGEAREGMGEARDLPTDMRCGRRGGKATARGSGGKHSPQSQTFHPCKSQSARGALGCKVTRADRRRRRFRASIRERFVDRLGFERLREPTLDSLRVRRLDARARGVGDFAEALDEQLEQRGGEGRRRTSVAGSSQRARRGGLRRRRRMAHQVVRPCAVARRCARDCPRPPHPAFAPFL